MQFTGIERCLPGHAMPLMISPLQCLMNETISLPLVYLSFLFELSRLFSALDEDI
jgi:hypothetical protein